MAVSYSIERYSWDNQAQREQLMQVRTAVFVEEQAVPVELEIDEFDDRAYHWLALGSSGEPLATVRMLSDGHIGRMAVVASRRGEGIGSALLQHCVELANSLGLFEVYLYAQIQAVDFYQAHGFVISSDEFMDAGIPHRSMRLQLLEQRLLGEHGGSFSVHDLASTALQMISQTKKILRILSYDLSPAVFDNTDMSNALSQLARSSRYSDIRILVLNTRTLVKRDHRLLALQRRLSSSIQIRTLANAGKHSSYDINDNLILCDTSGMISQSIKEPEKIQANFNIKPVVMSQASFFDDLWHRSIEDPDLRQLDI